VEIDRDAWEEYEREAELERAARVRRDAEIAKWQELNAIGKSLGEDTKNIDTVEGAKAFFIQAAGGPFNFDPAPSLVRAWRVLDYDDFGKVNLKKFTDGVKSLGFRGAIRKVFKLLDDRGMGMLSAHRFLSLVEGATEIYDEQQRQKKEAEERDDRAHEARMARMSVGGEDQAIDTWEELKNLLVKKYGIKYKFDVPKSLAAAWIQLDKSGDGKLTVSECSESLRMIGFRGNIRGIFKELGCDKYGVLELKNLDENAPAEYEAMMAAAAETQAAREAAAAKQMSRDEKWAGEDVNNVTTVEELRQWIIRRVGSATYFHPAKSIASAWQSMDVQNFGKLEHAKFAGELTRLGFRGNLKPIMADMDAEKTGWITLAMLSAEAAEEYEAALDKGRELAAEREKAFQKRMEFHAKMNITTTAQADFHNVETMEELKERLIKVHGAKFHFDSAKTLAFAWRSFDSGGDGKMQLKEWGEGLRAAGVDHAMKFFKMLDVKKTGILTLESLKVFDEAAYEEVQRQLAEEAVAAEQRQKELDKQQAFREKMNVGAMSDTMEVQGTLEALKSTMIKQYGAKFHFEPGASLHEAFGKVFDPNGRGKCAYAVFAKGCAAVSFRGNVKKIFAQVETAPGSGWVTLESFDSRAAQHQAQSGARKSRKSVSVEVSPTVALFYGPSSAACEAAARAAADRHGLSMIVVRERQLSADGSAATARCAGDLTTGSEPAAEAFGESAATTIGEGAATEEAAPETAEEGAHEATEEGAPEAAEEGAPETAEEGAPETAEEGTPRQPLDSAAPASAADAPEASHPASSEDPTPLVGGAATPVPDPSALGRQDMLEMALHDLHRGAGVAVCNYPVTVAEAGAMKKLLAAAKFGVAVTVLVGVEGEDPVLEQLRGQLGARCITASTEEEVDIALAPLLQAIRRSTSASRGSQLASTLGAETIAGDNETSASPPATNGEEPDDTAAALPAAVAAVQEAAEAGRSAEEHGVPGAAGEEAAGPAGSAEIEEAGPPEQPTAPVEVSAAEAATSVGPSGAATDPADPPAEATDCADPLAAGVEATNSFVPPVAADATEPAGPADPVARDTADATAAEAGDVESATAAPGSEVA